MIQVEIVEYQLDTFLSPPLELVRTVRPRRIRIRISRRRDHPCLRRVAVENHIAERRCNKQKYNVKTSKSAIKLSFYPTIIRHYPSIKFWNVNFILVACVLYYITEGNIFSDCDSVYLELKTRIFNIYIYIRCKINAG